ncbi:MAG: isoleucine--tRNA ligase [Armatimonadetes bacterium]|nr:isoleucine--tRNA ligase [Armatimonadota bacterium]
MDFKATLHLPDADATIPMKANLPSLEPQIQIIWDSEKIYHRLQEARKTAPVYVLHDGPPYTNSPIHIGTAMNKILKDFVVKSRCMMGYRTPYVPGFDNHGLPIEQAVMKKFADKKVTPTIPELRQACRDHAAEYLKVQSDQFRRLGVFGLWEKPYTTMDFRFEAEIVRTFKRLVLGGYVYKGLRPTLWSPTSRTALADTEIVYNDHVSKAIYVRFPLLEDPNKLFEGIDNVYTIIWTTTPWTIPANLACAFHPELKYALIKVGLDHYLVLEDLAPKLEAELGWEEPKVVKVLEGINFENMKFKHPIFDRPSIAVMADYVTTEDGTGVVHTAPSHGRDDFFTGQAYGLPVPNTVDEKGVLTHEAGEFEGVYYKNCDTVVVDRLAQVGALLKAYDYSHSYPYAERDGQPIIFRATEQWFVNLEHDNLRHRMLTSIDAVRWYPPQGQTRIESMIKHRPDWCISRQRPWGVGIPIFYGAKSRIPVMDPVAIELVAELVEREGSDAWFTKEASEILPPEYTHPETGETEFTKETDVLDVWFDSGSTSLCVLEGNVYKEWQEQWPADLYLEGSDQHRGWFNSSLIIGQATRDHAPYKAVLTHGFVTDAKGLKMSKRLGNVVDPVAASDQYGADIVRYWVAGTDYVNDVPCSDDLLKQFGESYRNVRNALRFLIGNLKGYSPSSAPAQLFELDEWIVEQTDLLIDDCVASYEEFDFGAVMSAVHNFCRQQLSSFYSDAIKDHMYCDKEDSPRRRSTQEACFRVAKAIIQLVAPVLVHTAEESWKKMHDTMGLPCNSVHESAFARPDSSRLQDIEASAIQVRFSVLQAVRQSVNGAFETFKGTDGIKNAQEVVAYITTDDETKEALDQFPRADLANYFKTSWVELYTGDSEVRFERTPYHECVRSRVRRPDVEEVEVDGEKVYLSRRDREAVGA